MRTNHIASACALLLCAACAPPTTAADLQGLDDGVRFIDVNGDGRVDVVLMNPDSIVILYQTGNGTLSEPIALRSPSNTLPDLIAVADVDGDGRNDLIVTYDALDAMTHVATFHQNEDGSFAAPSIPDAGS